MKMGIYLIPMGKESQYEIFIPTISCCRLKTEL